MKALLCPAIALLVVSQVAALAVSRVTVTRDDIDLRESCEIVIPPGTVIPDANTNGVLRIAADGITVRFRPGSELWGASPDAPGDTLRGVGIWLNGHRNVRVEGARVHGYFNGLIAVGADGLQVVGGDFSGNYRQRLRSTPAGEDGADWLFPHHNDERKWRDEYGGAVCVEASRGIVVRGVKVRRGQNGILLDRVAEARVYDNDCSFLSGWGIALWRSSRNIISRNAFDFCVRGHVEGVYNRGQDSAGILCFEQCNENLFVENSATHCGDGFFAFAGREAIGEVWMERERDRLRRETGRADVEALVRVPPELARDLSGRGCNRNLMIGNDFSYSAAHGLEITFSEGNLIARNRLVENGICGLWGGYSSDNLIAENEFAGNGGMAYGLERGGANFEHASGNRFLRNRFLNDRCAIHLWWDADEGLRRLPGVSGNDRGVSGNAIVGNTFLVQTNHPFANLRPGERLTVLQLRDDGTGNVRSNLYLGNQVRLAAPEAIEFAVDADCVPLTNGPAPRYQIPTLRPPGRTRPVGARAQLKGRHQIVLDEWGPWDHERPWVRTLPSRQDGVVGEVFGLREKPQVEILEGEVTASWEVGDLNSWRLSLSGRDGVLPYRVRASGPQLDRILAGTLVAATWKAAFFPWGPDPRVDLDAWRRLAVGPEAIAVEVPLLSFPYGGGGPRNLALGEAFRQRGPGPDHFGMIASTRVALPAGEWRVRTRSDDGVRVLIDGREVLANWTWHGPTVDEGRFSQPRRAEVEIQVEHFEIDGYATLEFELLPAATTDPGP